LYRLVWGRGLAAKLRDNGSAWGGCAGGFNDHKTEFVEGAFGRFAGFSGENFFEIGSDTSWHLVGVEGEGEFARNGRPRNATVWGDKEEEVLFDLNKGRAGFGCRAEAAAEGLQPVGNAKKLSGLNGDAIEFGKFGLRAGMLGLGVEDAGDLVFAFGQTLFDKRAVNGIGALEELEFDGGGEWPDTCSGHRFGGTHGAGHYVGSEEAVELGGETSPVLEEHPVRWGENVFRVGDAFGLAKTLEV
jgi:hypothetical protein